MRIYNLDIKLISLLIFSALVSTVFITESNAIKRKPIEYRKQAILNAAWKVAAKTNPKAHEVVTLGFPFLDQKITSLSEQLENSKQKVEKINQKIKQLSSLGNLEDNLKEISEREATRDAIIDEIEIIEQEIESTDLLSQKIEKEAYSSLLNQFLIQTKSNDTNQKTTLINKVKLYKRYLRESSPAVMNPY